MKNTNATLIITIGIFLLDCKSQLTRKSLMLINYKSIPLSI